MSQSFTAFHQSALILPYALMDLDDTLFQTLRKIQAWQLPTEQLLVATVNKYNEPLSYFTPKQAQFFNWLIQTTELIPVTARDRHEILRVKLPFASWQVLTHGAVILQPDGQPLISWQQTMQDKLQSLQAKLQAIQNWLVTASLADAFTVTPHTDSFGQQILTIYIAVKHRQKQPQALLELANTIKTQINDFSHYFYIHVNANNLAILPYDVDKKHAVKFLQHQHLDNHRACFGFADSLADLGFLQLLDWYGTPPRGQLHEQIIRQCDDK